MSVVVAQQDHVSRMLEIIENDVIPLTRAGVSKGNKVFGAAILRKSDRSVVIAGTNNEVENPLWHGEVHTVKQFYEMPASDRPQTSECIFLSTHEPCSLCLSAITWAGFDNFYYLFGYEDTKEKFNIPHDLKILQEVFGISHGEYVRENAFWTSYSLEKMIVELPDAERDLLQDRMSSIAGMYAELSTIYQASREESAIPLR